MKRSHSEMVAGSGKLPREWIGTLCNYTVEQVQAFKNWASQNCDFCNVGYEVCPSTGTPHLQIFSQMKTRPNFAAFKRLFPSVDVTPKTYGSSYDCSKYTEKEGNLAFSVGTFVEKNPGKRTDLAKVAADIQSGSTFADIAESHPTAIIQYGSGISRLLSVFEPVRDRSVPKTVRVYFGSTGTGKTRLAFDNAPSEPYVWDPDLGNWWDGYNRHSYVIMDEFRGQLTMGSLLRLLDRYPKRVQVKGGSCQFVADTIVITSPMHPRFWYRDVPSDRIEQLLRRICEIRDFDSDPYSGGV